MRVELIAARAGVHRSSIYRRWRDPTGIIADLAAEVTASLEQPDTGSLRGDLAAMANQLATRLDAVGSALVRALGAWPDVRVQRTLERFWAERRTDVGRILARYGSDAEPADVLRLAAGPIHYRAVIERRPIDRHVVDDAVDAALTRAEYPAS